MAHSMEQWQKARFLWELDKPFSYIIENTGISGGQISKKSKAENWKKETKGNELKPLIKQYDKEKETNEAKGNSIVSKMCTMKDYEITLLDKVIQDETGRKSLLFSTANLSLIRKNQMLTKNTKQITTKVKFYEEGKVIKEEEELRDIELNATDLKTLDEGIDKNAVSLELAPRHASQKISLNNQTNIQQNNISIEWE